jgi:hypothetical protein
MLARNFVERAQYRGVHDAPAAEHEQELHATDALVACRWLGHATSLLALLDRLRTMLKRGKTPTICTINAVRGGLTPLSETKS